MNESLPVQRYVNFLRWTTQFPADQVLEHPQYNRVFELSTQQCMRFLTLAQGDDAMLFVQRPERWMLGLPVDEACVSDRLYLVLSSISPIEGVTVKPIAIGMGFHDSRMLAAFAKAKRLWIRSCVLNDQDRVSSVGDKVTGVTISRRDVHEALRARDPQNRHNFVRNQSV
jgi:hypothetical protein